ncbi:MAG TPA: ABC transporter substrate-binding protein [Gaiellaceae bacterium]|nr:ABC transporter substrate-binding protein [Gaiellaceae bacterium]
MSAARLLVVVLLVSAAGAASAARALAPARLSVVLDWTPNPNHVGLFYAQQHGFFTRDGLAVAVHAPPDPTAPLKLVAAGAADLGLSYEQELFFARSHHAPVTAVAAVVPRPLNSLIWLDSSIHSLRDLRGRSVGITGVPSDYAMLDTVLAHANLQRSQVKVVIVGYNLLAALLAHRVDAVLGVYPNVEGIELTLLHQHPHVVTMDRAGVPDYDELVLVANSSRLRSDQRYRAAVDRFVAALDAATAAARAHPAAAIATLRRATQLTPAFLARSTPLTLRLLAARGGSVCLHPLLWRRFGSWMAKRRLLDGPVPSGVVTTAFLPRSCAGP